MTTTLMNMNYDDGDDDYDNCVVDADADDNAVAVVDVERIHDLGSRGRKMLILAGFGHQ